MRGDRRHSKSHRHRKRTNSRDSSGSGSDTGSDSEESLDDEGKKVLRKAFGAKDRGSMHSDSGSGDDKDQKGGAAADKRKEHDDKHHRKHSRGAKKQKGKGNADGQQAGSVAKQQRDIINAQLQALTGAGNDSARGASAQSFRLGSRGGNSRAPGKAGETGTSGQVRDEDLDVDVDELVEDEDLDEEDEPHAGSSKKPSSPRARHGSSMRAGSMRAGSSHSKHRSRSGSRESRSGARSPRSAQHSAGGIRIEPDHDRGASAGPDRSVSNQLVSAIQTGDLFVAKKPGKSLLAADSAESQPGAKDEFGLVRLGQGQGSGSGAGMEPKISLSQMQADELIEAGTKTGGGKSKGKGKGRRRSMSRRASMQRSKAALFEKREKRAQRRFSVAAANTSSVQRLSHVKSTAASKAADYGTGMPTRFRKQRRRASIAATGGRLLQSETGQVKNARAKTKAVVVRMMLASKAKSEKDGTKPEQSPPTAPATAKTMTGRLLPKLAIKIADPSAAAAGSRSSTKSKSSASSSATASHQNQNRHREQPIHSADKTAQALDGLARQRNSDWISGQIGADEEYLPSALKKKLRLLAQEVAAGSDTDVSKRVAEAAAASHKALNSKASSGASTGSAGSKHYWDAKAPIEAEGTPGVDPASSLGDVVSFAIQKTLGTADAALSKTKASSGQGSAQDGEPAEDESPLSDPAAQHKADALRKDKDEQLHNRIALACATPFSRGVNLAVIDDLSRASFISYYESGEYGRGVKLACKITKRYLRSLVRPSEIAQRAKQAAELSQSMSGGLGMAGNGRGLGAGAGHAAARGLRSRPAGSGSKQRVVVIDVDDTALSSYQYMLRTQLQRLP